MTSCARHLFNAILFFKIKNDEENKITFKLKIIIIGNLFLEGKSKLNFPSSSDLHMFGILQF